MFAGSSSSLGYTYGQNDGYIVRTQKDTILNSYGNAYTVKNYKDTCACVLADVGPQSNIPPGVRIFPNPVTYSATILVQGDIGTRYMYSLYNESGQCVIKNGVLQSTAHGQFFGHVEKGNLATGEYFCEILNQDGIKLVTYKIVIE